MVRGAGPAILGRAFVVSQVRGQRSLCERTLLLGSRILRSPSNPALGILPRAFEATHDATGIV